MASLQTGWYGRSAAGVQRRVSVDATQEQKEAGRRWARRRKKAQKIERGVARAGWYNLASSVSEMEAQIGQCHLPW